MITIKPHTSHTIGISTFPIDKERLFEQIKAHINSAGPHISSIQIFNKTKTATVAYTVTEGKLIINITNDEQDSVFKLG